ncbi:unnamed protein product [Prorocentrum cordatum]|uniref:HEAT repeat-containing protein 1 n=1 Tax=Prorocentrum cordatum TaxID=2364126 RepID=A0ABN9SIQ4_9DINO|nr:unnamed protein product [Polarella glacialis]
MAGGRHGPGRPRSAGSAGRSTGTSATLGLNPFAAGNAEFLQKERLRSTLGGRLPTGRPASASGAVRSRRREHEVLQMLDRLEEKDTMELGVRQLQEVLASLQTPDELTWFLRVAFDERKPLASHKGRREQLLLLPRVVAHFGAAAADSGALEGRVLPCLARALRGPETEEVVTRAAVEILGHCAPLCGEEGAGLGFVGVCSALLRELLDPLVLGSGTDLAMKQRCVQVLGGLTPTIRSRENGRAR